MTRSRMWLATVCVALSSGSVVGQTLLSQTLLWSTPNPVLIYLPVTFYAEVIGNGTLAPTGTVTFDNAGTPMGSGTVSSVNNTNFILFSSQFNNSPWGLSDNNGVLTANYSGSPLGDQTAYRYQNLTNQPGTYVYQDVGELPGTQPVTFSVWIESNTTNVQDIHVGIQDLQNGGGFTEVPCMATPGWQRCSVTTPRNSNRVEAYIGGSQTPWQWDVSIWGAQVEPSTSPGVYVSSASSRGTATLGLATFVTDGLTSSLNPITGLYGGDGNYLESMSTPNGDPEGVARIQIVAYCLSPEFSQPCSTVPLPTAAMGVPYSTTLSAVGGTPPYTWALAEGTLPAGLTFSSSGTITGTPTAQGYSSSATNFQVELLDSSNPQQELDQDFQIILGGAAPCPSDSVRRGDSCGGGGPPIFSIYPSEAAAGTSNQSIALYGCIPNLNGNYGTLSLNLPTGFTQVGPLTAGPAPFGNGSMVQGMISIAFNAPLGTGSNPLQIGLNQIFDGCNYNTNTESYSLTQYCPASVTFGTQMQEGPFVGSEVWNPPINDRTGFGEWAEMNANPGAPSNWNTAPIWENVTNVSSGSGACSQTITLPGPDICSFGASNGMVGGAAWQAIDPLHRLSILPSTENVLWDQHYYNRTSNVLGSSQTNSCTATCMQWYYCGNTVEGEFSVQYTLTKQSGYTQVTVSKTQVP